MQQQRAIVHREDINRKGEIKYFQIPLQGTAIKIIGVEASVFVFTEAMQPQPAAEAAPATGSGSITPAPSAMSGCPNPGAALIEQVSSTVDSSKNEQVFRIGAAVNPGFVYSCGVYSVVVSVTAIDGDTPATIAAKLAGEVNNTSLAIWSQYGSNNRNFKPSAQIEGDLITLFTDPQHSFFASGTGSCSAEPPPPPPPPPSNLLTYDPLFFINRNEKAGTVSLQSPDVTDIFLQCDAYRDDKNINYGDFTQAGMMQGEWLKGRKRIATDITIQTASPILEAYYQDSLGEYYNKDMSYQLNLFIWYEKLLK